MASVFDLANPCNYKVFGYELFYSPGKRAFTAGPFTFQESLRSHRELGRWGALDWDLYIRRSLHRCLTNTFRRFVRRN